MPKPMPKLGEEQLKELGLRFFNEILEFEQEERKSAEVQVFNGDFFSKDSETGVYLEQADCDRCGFTFVEGEPFIK